MNTKKKFSFIKLTKKFRNFFIGVLFFFSVFFTTFFLFSEVSNAGMLPDGWSNEIDAELNLTKKDGKGVEQIESYVVGIFVPLIKYLIIGLSIFSLIISLFSIIFAIGSEAETKAKEFGTHFGFAILGFILISFSEKIAEAVEPSMNGENLQIGDISIFESMAAVIVNFSSILIGGIAVAVVVISGIKIIQSHGEGVGDEFKKIGSAGAGLIIILLSRKFIYDIFFTNYGMKGVNEGAAASTVQEVMGVVSYFMQFIAIGGVGLIVLAGIYYISSSGEGNDNTALAKGIMKNVSIGLVVLMSSYSLVTIFLPSSPTIT